MNIYSALHGERLACLRAAYVSNTITHLSGVYVEFWSSLHYGAELTKIRDEHTPFHSRTIGEHGKGVGFGYVRPPHVEDAQQ